MPEMHPSMRRLYNAAVDPVTGKAKTQAELARALYTSSQVIKNWETRGISQQGATGAQATLGVSATWLLSGKGSRFVATGTPLHPEAAVAPIQQPADAARNFSAPTDSRSVRLDEHTLREGLVTLRLFFKANERKITMDDGDLDLLVRACEWNISHDDDLLTEIFSRIRAKPEQQGVDSGNQGEVGSKKASAHRRVR